MAFSKQTNLFLLTTEMSAFSVLCFTGVLVLVQSEHILSLALPMNDITLFFFLISLMNERIQIKLDKIYEALYDLPWFAYTVQQRKLFLIVLQCNQIKMKLHAGALHKVSLEQFLAVVRYAYSNILVIKKLLELQN